MVYLLQPLGQWGPVKPWLQKITPPWPTHMPDIHTLRSHLLPVLPRATAAPNSRGRASLCHSCNSCVVLGAATLHTPLPTTHTYTLAPAHTFPHKPLHPLNSQRRVNSALPGGVFRCHHHRRRGELQPGPEAAVLPGPGLREEDQYLHHGRSHSFHRHGHGRCWAHPWGRGLGEGFQGVLGRSSESSPEVQVALNIKVHLGQKRQRMRDPDFSSLRACL